MLVLGRGNGWPSRDISRRAKTAVDEGRPPATREPSVHRVLHERGSSAKSESTVDHAAQPYQMLRKAFSFIPNGTPLSRLFGSAVVVIAVAAGGAIRGELSCFRRSPRLG